jgi:hypothetical protein
MTEATLIAVFPNHLLAEMGLKDLAAKNFKMADLSIVGQGYHTDEQAIGFYNTGDRITFWGKRGAFWGGLWGLFFGGVSLMLPGVGQVMILGYLAATVVAALEGAVVVGSVSALVAALTSIGIPKNSVIQYETALRADGFLVTVHGSEEELTRARAILGHSGPSSIELHHAIGARAAAAAA